MENFKNVGTWWNDRDIDLVEINNKVYALYGWNGETYLNCWECTGKFHMEASEEKFEITPIYKNIVEGDFEISGYKVV